MEANNSTTIIKGCINKFKEENDLKSKDSEIFELFSLSQIMKNEDITFENIMDSITDGGNDGGIDSIIILHDGDYIEEDTEYKCKQSSVLKLMITQCKTENTFKENVIDKLLSTFPILFNLDAIDEDLAKRFNPQIINKRNILTKIWTDTCIGGGKIEVEINYACLANDFEVVPAFESKQEQLKKLCKDLFSTDEIQFKCYSSKDLLSLYRTHKRHRSQIVFKDMPLSVSYGDSGFGYIGLVKLIDYKSFLTLDDKINEELFESNIRHFQGNVDVNNKIRKTLENIFDRDFWWLNNGITIIAENPTPRSKILVIENAQIVNGLQTSYSIFNLGNINNDDERSVLVKVIICNNKDITDNIIEATNYQNAVSPGLLRATDDIQKDIEMYFLQHGYYYDRRKNYYKNQGKPGNKIFGIQFLAQAIKAIILKDPHSARATPTSLLKTESSYKSIFKKRDDYKAYLNCCLIFSRTYHAILNIDDKSLKNNIINFKYHIALLTTVMVLGNKFNYTMEDISNIDITNVDDNIMNKAIMKMEKLINSYKETHPQNNLINVAKSSEFTTFIKDELK